MNTSESLNAFLGHSDWISCVNTLKEKLSFKCSSRVTKQSPVWIFHIFIVFSLEPLSILSLDEISTQQTDLKCPLNVLKHSPEFKFHNLIVLSPEPLENH